MTTAELEGAKSGVIYQLIAREKTVSAAARQAMLSHFRDTPLEYNRHVWGIIIMSVHVMMGWCCNDIDGDLLVYT